MKETIFRMMLQRQRGLWGCGELSRCTPSTLPLSPASSLSRELVSNVSLPLCEAVETPQKRNVFGGPGLATSTQPHSPRTPCCYLDIGILHLTWLIGGVSDIFSPDCASKCHFGGIQGDFSPDFVLADRFGGI